MVFIDPQLLSHPEGNFLAVACQHHCLLDTQCLQCCYSLQTVVFYNVVDDDVASVCPVYGNMDNGARVILTVVPLCSYGVHHLRIAHADRLPTNVGTNTLASHLFHIFYLTAVSSLVGERIAKGGCYGMMAEMFYMCSQM